MGSRSLRFRVIFLCVALLMGGCGELTPPSERREEIGYHTVRAGDTLYSIAWYYGIDHRELAAWNNIPPPYLIHPGQRLAITPPLARRTIPPAPPSSRPAGSPPANPVASLPKSGPKASIRSKPPAKSRPPKKTTKNVGNGKKVRTSSLSGVENGDNGTKITSSWRWPAQGKVAAGFDPGSGKKGIDITGRSGQSIFSAAAGDVVYSGSGLLGYGKLVIIKHDDVYLSAYGHNSQLLVKEGDKVAMGQEIAKMGVSPKEGAMLHFEIRKEGKPVDPTRYLPK